jgi:hypothetical protein
VSFAAPLLLAWLLAQGATPATPAAPAGPAPPVEQTPAPPALPAPPVEQAPAPPVEQAPAPPVEQAPAPVPLSAPVPLPAPDEPPRYGDAGSSELSLALGYSSASGLLAGGGFRRFVLAGVAPGVEASVQSGAGSTLGLVLGTVRLVPVRTGQLALVVTGRAGRVLLSSHDDGWGAGGGAGVIVSLAAHVGLELGYDVLWLLPSTFCADLSSCVVQGPVVGLRLAF